MRDEIDLLTILNLLDALNYCFTVKVPYVLHQDYDLWNDESDDHNYIIVRVSRRIQFVIHYYRQDQNDVYRKSYYKILPQEHEGGMISVFDPDYTF